MGKHDTLETCLKALVRVQVWNRLLRNLDVLSERPGEQDEASDDES